MPFPCQGFTLGGGGAEIQAVTGVFEFEEMEDNPLISLLPPVLLVQGRLRSAAQWLDTNLQFPHPPDH